MKQNFDLNKILQTANLLRRLPFFRGKGLVPTLAAFGLAAALTLVGGSELLSKIGLARQSQSHTAASSVSSETFKARVVRVSDGDTLVVETPRGQQVKIRVLGMDTPEKFVTAKLKKDAEECGTTAEKMSYLGQLASKHAHKYLSPGKEVVVEPHGQGKYGRLIARVIVDGKDYAYWMIKEGYSCVYKAAAPKEYEKALEEAKKNRRGLWRNYYSIMECLCK